jgi:hypothetical protein
VQRIAERIAEVREGLSQRSSGVVVGILAPEERGQRLASVRTGLEDQESEERKRLCAERRLDGCSVLGFEGNFPAQSKCERRRPLRRSRELIGDGRETIEVPRDRLAFSR